jgi:hypothetical protein
MTVDQIDGRMIDESLESPADAERGWSRFGAFPILLATIFGLLWRDRRAVPEVPHPRVLKDARLR